MEFRLLGPVTVVDGDREVTIPQRRQRALLAVLLLHLGETVPADRIVEELWGADAPRTALASLHNAVSQLRRVVGADALVTRATGYALEVAPDRVDVQRFEHLLAEAQAAFSVQDHATAAVVLREALALWRGPALADLAYEPFAQTEIRRLEELRDVAVEERLEAELARGKHEEVVPELERLVAEAPLRERPHRLLMLALYRSGRQAEALAAYRRARQMLVDELGIEPGPELRELERAILRQDPSLLLPEATPVGAPSSPRFRRLATILFADVAVTGADDRELDAELLHDALVGFHETAREVIRRHGGWTDRVSGSTLMAAFGAEAAEEAHATHAARAALDLRGAVSALDERLGPRGARVELRLGVASGEVLVSGSQAQGLFVSGEAVQIASGLQQAAAPREIVIGPFARRLLPEATVEPVGELGLKGRARPVAAFRLLELADQDAEGATRPESPLAGRTRELRTLRATLREARRAAAARAVCVVGPAGIGKSRLARELARGAAGFDVLGARCASYGEGLTYLPVRMLVGRDRDGVAAQLDGLPDDERVADLLTSFAGPAPAIARALTRWCEARAARRPLLLIIDDLHRAEPTFLDLLEYVGAHARAPVVLLGLAREELFDDHPEALPGWARLELAGLTLASTEALVDHLLAGAPLPSDSRARVFDAAEGNPLFVEQLVALATEGESLGEERTLPATVQALLATRLDRLGPGERAVLERAAVVGREFTAGYVSALLAPEAVPTTRRHLASLVRRGFVDRTGDSTYRFRHVLLQEAAYRAASKSLCAELHERLADALDGDGGAPDAIVGYHLERAYRLRTELGPPNRAALRIAEDAGRRLGAAGIRAWKRYDAPAAVNLLERAAALLPANDPARLEMLCELGEVFKWTNDLDRAAAALESVEEVAQAARDTRLVARARVQQAWPRFARGQTDAEAMLELTAWAIPIFEAHEDDRALGLAWRLVGAVHGPIRMHWSLCADAASRALEHYRRTQFSPAPCLVMLGASLKDGPEPVAAAIEQCERLSSAAGGDPAVDAHIRVVLAALEEMRGNTKTAREHLRVSSDLIGARGGATSPDWAVCASSIEADAGAYAAAAAILEAARDAAEQREEQAWVATLSALLAEVRYEEDMLDEALELSTAAMALALADDLVAQVGWRRVRAKVLARTGAHAEGERLARQAIELLGESDAVQERATTMIALSEVLCLASRHREAEPITKDAFSLLARKGATTVLDRAKQRLSALGHEVVAG